MKIALMGYARSGKDEMYEIMKNYINKVNKEGVGRLAFGDALKQYAHEITDIPTEPKPRGLYEQFGKAMRDIDPDVWIKQLEKTYIDLSWGGVEHFVITDLRQPNECQWAIDNGFTVVYVACDEEIRKERSKGDTSWVAVNPSETEIANLPYSLMVWNEGDLRELQITVKMLLKEGLPQ